MTMPRVQRTIILIVIWLTVGAPSGLLNSGAATESAKEFRWLVASKAKDAAALAKLMKDFESELQPDEFSTSKTIAKAGVFADAALVFVDALARDKVKPWNRISEVFNYSLRTGQKSKIKLPTKLWAMRLHEPVRFEPSRTPDIVFTYRDCTECEAVQLLSALHFDPQANQWEPRVWQKDERFVLIDSDDQHGDYALRYACMHGIRDYDGDGWLDLAVWCRESELDYDSGKVHSSKEWLSLFVIKDRHVQKMDLTQGHLADLIRQSHCRANPRHALCGRK